MQLLQETFDPIIQVTTGRDLIPAMVYGRSARDQDYTGMHCAVLTVRDTVVSAGLFRIMGSEIAELPLVATARDSQGLGYFEALFACIERLLASLEVKHFVLPAASLEVKHFVLPAAEEAESIWTERFGFTKRTQDESLKMSQCPEELERADRSMRIHVSVINKLEDHRVDAC